MTFEEFKSKFNFKKTSDLEKNCCSCDKFYKFQISKPTLTGVCNHYHIEEENMLDHIVDQQCVCDRYLPHYSFRSRLSRDEKTLFHLEQKEQEEIKQKENERISLLCQDFNDDEPMTDEEKVGLLAEIARDDYGEAAFEEEQLSQTEMKAVIAGDDKLEKLVENEKKFRSMLQQIIERKHYDK